ncbi:Hypothetical predicted protein [Marmota monax]|uniref:PDZ domain-containing protein n=1 Tax=Marmota monax TaxID=9995 RepID=A0A5E4C415_MARMO|nr:hypothetical protein GHT09_012466 [Marmota monax]VTJ75771.1 Hypothetical predicted protein [Marmota monax]
MTFGPGPPSSTWTSSPDAPPREAVQTRLRKASGLLHPRRRQPTGHPHGLEKVPGIFISRMVPGGLAESTGLLAANDEVLEVNGIEVAGKTLDQVTDMMIANSHNLIVTVKPANQRNNVVRSSRTSGSSGQSTDSTASHHSLPVAHVLQNFHPDEMESDEEADIVIEGTLEPQSVSEMQGTPSGSLVLPQGGVEEHRPAVAL